MSEKISFGMIEIIILSSLLVLYGIAIGTYVVFANQVIVSHSLMNEVCAELNDGHYVFDSVQSLETARSDGLKERLICKKRPETSPVIVFVEDYFT